MSRYALTLKPAAAVGRSVDVKLRMRRPDPPAVDVPPVAAGVVDCQKPHCLVQWVAPWYVTDPGPVFGAMTSDILQNLFDTVIPDDPETEEDESAFIPGGSNNCRIPLVWVLTYDAVEGNPAQLDDFSIVEYPESIASPLRSGPWQLICNGVHAAEYMSNHLAFVTAQAYLEDKFFPNDDPVPFGDPIVWQVGNA